MLRPMADNLHFMLSIELFLALVLFHLLEKPLLLSFLISTTTSLLVSVFTVEGEDARDVPPLLRVLVVDRLPGSFHFSVI